MKSQPRDLIIAAGVRNLKEYGYPSVNSENILTDPVYRAFFMSMLQSPENREHETCRALLEECIAMEESR